MLSKTIVPPPSGEGKGVLVDHYIVATYIRNTGKTPIKIARGSLDRVILPWSSSTHVFSLDVEYLNGVEIIVPSEKDASPVSLEPGQVTRLAYLETTFGGPTADKLQKKLDLVYSVADELNKLFGLWNGQLSVSLELSQEAAGKNISWKELK